VTATGSDDEGNVASDTADATIAITFRLDPGIEVTKQSDPMFLPEPGGPVTFIVGVTNYNPERVTLTWLTDSIHGDVTEVVAGKVEATTCSVPQTIPAGSFYTCTFQAIVGIDPPLLAGQSETDILGVVAYDDQGAAGYATASATVQIIPIGGAEARVYVPLVLKGP